MVGSHFRPVVGSSHSDTCSLRVEDCDCDDDDCDDDDDDNCDDNALTLKTQKQEELNNCIWMLNGILRFVRKCVWFSPLARCCYPNQIGGGGL